MFLYSLINTHVQIEKINHEIVIDRLKYLNGNLILASKYAFATENL